MMATSDTLPTFHGTAVRIDYAAGVRKPRVLDAEIRGLVLRQEQNGISEDGLIALIEARVAQQDGLVASLVSRTDDAIELVVTEAEP
jgi:hypothetical protein